MRRIITAKHLWFRLLAILIVLLALVYGLLKIGQSEKPFVPYDFLAARDRGALLAEEIVSLSKESINNLRDIGSQDESGNFSLGLDLVLQEISRNETARDRAIGLSKELETMATMLVSIKPAGAVNIGTQAIISESQIVQRLINYNGHIFQLLDILRSRFNGGAVTNHAEKVETLIAKMNLEASSINQLNDKYKELMAQFDSLIAH